MELKQRNKWEKGNTVHKTLKPLLLQQTAGKKIQTEWVKKENGWREQDEKYEKLEKLEREF